MKKFNENSIMCIYYDSVDEDYILEVFTESSYNATLKSVARFEKLYPTLYLCQISYLGSFVKDINLSEKFLSMNVFGD